ncbi:type VI secretion system membrane subunit TssM [Burkholderia ubonensis]|uniref:type VI secretion system membrane subunit TssM n=1 Tax=Burkholderia ubonensis TaxID=101571 RepID=UPI0007599516|nr:type VI secretion system membrane subunit TssM [Burkholderia ubonensis]KVQ05126.1 type VI secretion protein [Burkholderia ubonensis]
MKLLNWLVRPIVLSLVGVLALAFIVWVKGPLVAFAGNEPLATSGRRWTMIAILLLLWAAYWGGRWLATRLANVRFTRVVAEEPPEPAPGKKETEADIATLKQRFDEAMAILRKDRVKGRLGSQHVYQLPWYMFVGPPGTGKTTALMHSGLRFPLAGRLDKQATGGVGSTRNCDWWFTDDAVLLDTAGRFTTQDTFSEADQAAWAGFLQLLHKNRPRRPLNGVIVALSAQDLLQLSDTQRALQASAVRERLKELYTKLGMRFPVYVIVTKCDLLAGFVEFFDDLGRDEREQVWGITFPFAEQGSPDDALAAFPSEFEALEKQLQARVLHRMQQETDARRRALIYGFPQQFAGLENLLQSFLNDAFSTSRFEQSALLRGVYFTSSTQEGRPIDRVMSAVASALGLQRQIALRDVSSGRAYFITHLMRDVIFQEAGLAGANAVLERRRGWLQRIALGAIGVVLLLALAGFFISYQRNRVYVDDVQQHVAELQKRAQATQLSDNPLVLLPLLNAARDLPGGYTDRDKPVPWLSRLWLYQGGKLGLEAQKCYRRLLRQTLLPLVVRRMEEELRRGDANNPDFQYEVLRTYLMLGDSAHFDADAVRLWTDVDWRRGPLRDASDDAHNDIDGHLAALLQPAQFDASQPLDDDLVAQARVTLARMPLARRMFHRVVRELEQTKLPEFAIAGVAGRNATFVLTRKSGAPLTRGVPGAYTRAGYAKFLALRDTAVIDIEKDDWVLGREESVLTPNGIDDLKVGMTRLYEDEYIRQWDALLNDVDVVPFDSAEKGARIANALAAPDSPLRLLVLAAAQETTLSNAKTVSVAEQGVAALTGKLDAMKKRLHSALGNQPDDVMAPPTAEQNPVDVHFQALHDIAAKPGTDGPIPLDTQLAAIKDAVTYLVAVDAARRQGQPPPPSDALTRLKLAAQGVPQPIAEVLGDVANNSSALIAGGERARLNALWQGNVASLCRQALDGRYPLVRTSTRDATPDDFGKVLGPGGLIDDFFQKNLKSYVDTHGPRWRWRAGTDSLGIPVDVLTQFERAALIRDALFRAGGHNVSVRFAVKTLTIDPSLTQVALDVDGHQLIAKPGEPQSMVFQWPSGKGTGKAYIEFTPPGSGVAAHADGPWALLRLMDAVNLRQTAQADRFTFEVASNGRRAEFELDASSVINPFRGGVLDSFRCSDRL